MVARPMQKSLPASRSTTTRDFSAAVLSSRVSSVAIASVAPLPASGRLKVMRRIGPSCCEMMSSVMRFLLPSEFLLLRSPPLRRLLGRDLRARLDAPQVPGAPPRAGRSLATAGGGNLLVVEIDDLAARPGDHHRLHLQLGGKLEIDAAHHRDHQAVADHDRAMPA